MGLPTRNGYFSNHRGKILEFSGTLSLEAPGSGQPARFKTNGVLQGILKNKNELIQQQRIAGHNLLDKEHRNCAKNGLRMGGGGGFMD